MKGATCEVQKMGYRICHSPLRSLRLLSWLENFTLLALFK